VRVDPDLSVYHEADGAEDMFTREEIAHLRYLLRRLRFLEAQVRESGGRASGHGGGIHAELEVQALEWVLKDCDYLPEQNRELAVSGNH
jgi:hypothetical protein